MKRFIQLLLAVLLCSVSFSSVTLAASPEGAPAETVVVVSPEDEQGWSGEDVTGTGGSHEYVEGPETPPLGEGSVELTAAAPTTVETCLIPPIIPGDPCIFSFPIPTPNTYTYSTEEFNGTELDEVLALSFESYKTGDTLTNPAIPQLGMDVESGPAGSPDFSAQIYFTPTSGVVSDEWQEWDTLSSANNFWHSNSFTTPSCNIFSIVRCTFDELRASLPADTRIANAGKIFFNVFTNFLSTTPASYNVDNFSFATSTTNTTFNFEQHQPPVVTPPTTTTPPATTTTSVTGARNTGLGGGNDFPPEEGVAVAGEQTGTTPQTSSTSTDAKDDSKDTAGQSDKKDSKEKTPWYWWLIGLVTLMILYYLLGGRRDRDDEV